DYTSRIDAGGIPGPYRKVFGRSRNVLVRHGAHPTSEMTLYQGGRIAHRQPALGLHLRRTAQRDPRETTLLEHHPHSFGGVRGSEFVALCRVSTAHRARIGV